jgi:drug/metabolite transporter (DMT)-like permease
VGYEVFLGILVIPAMILVVQGIEVQQRIGLLLGIVSAILASIFASYNKLYITRANPLQITFFEITSAGLFISVVLVIVHTLVPSDFTLLYGIDFNLYLPSGMDWMYLGILALVCTTLAYVLAIKSLQHLSAFATNLTINLEPVYGIVLAWLLLKENKELTPGFYLGVLIIIGVVFLYPFIKWRNRRTLHTNMQGRMEEPTSRKAANDENA